MADALAGNLVDAGRFIDAVRRLRQMLPSRGEPQAKEIGIAYCPMCFAADIGGVPFVEGLEEWAALMVLADFVGGYDAAFTRRVLAAFESPK